MKNTARSIRIILFDVIMEIILVVVAISLPAVAIASELCQRISDNYPTTGYWSRDCGPEPGKDFIAEMKKDCIQTTRQIDARPGASWNSEWGWVSQEQCESLEQSAQRQN